MLIRVDVLNDAGVKLFSQIVNPLHTNERAENEVKLPFTLIDGNLRMTRIDIRTDLGPMTAAPSEEIFKKN